MTQRRNFWMRWRVRTGYPVAVIFLVLAAPTPRSILIGGAVALLGILIRGASSGYLRKYEELATTGPYAYTRNPLYFGSAFLAAGFAIAGNSWLAGALVVAYFAIFYTAVMRNEENDLRARFGAVFNEYAAGVPLFFPRVTVPRTNRSANSATRENIFVAPIPPQSGVQRAYRHARRTRRDVAPHVDPFAVRLLIVGEELLQAVNGVHQPLELRAVDQIECPLFARKHIECGTPRRCDHSGRFLGGKITVGNCFHRQPHENSQAAKLTALFVNLFLGWR